MQKCIPNKLNLKWSKANNLYLISFLLPAIIFINYFLLTEQSGLTIDLANQYLDFLTFYRDNLFVHPLKLIYTFSNGFGNSMLGTDIYYLLSPFNLLLFLFPTQFISQAILLIITLKIGTIGLTGFYYFKQKLANNYYCLSLSLAYALSSYNIAYFFNLMWLDSVILLPLLIRAIELTLQNKKNHLLLITFLLWFTNFYTGYIALLFGLCYLLSKLYFVAKNKRLAIFWQYLKNSIYASCFNLFLFVPLFAELFSGKGKQATHFSFGFAYSPYQQIAKLATGAYNFDENTQKGIANIYFTMIMLAFIILYFLSKKISWQEKIANGILLSFLSVSLFWKPLILLWHLSKFPTYYPARFSFALIFFCLILASQYLVKNERLNTTQLVILYLIFIGLAIFLLLNNQTQFLNKQNKLLSICFIIVSLLFITCLHSKEKSSEKFLLAIVITELIINLFFSLSQISYQAGIIHQNNRMQVMQAVNYLQKHNSNFYRISKTFTRSDDDSFTNSYYDINQFNSFYLRRVSGLCMDLGLVSSNYIINNYGGTPITDSILGIKYYLVPKNNQKLSKKKQMKYYFPNHRSDINDYPAIKSFQQLKIYHNIYALPILWLNPHMAKKVVFDTHNIAKCQNILFCEATGQNINLFKQLNLLQARTKNLKLKHSYYVKQNKKKTAEINYHIKIKDNDSYYLELPRTVNRENAKIYLNHQYYELPLNDYKEHLHNIANQSKNKSVLITIKLKRQKIKLSKPRLWKLNTVKLYQVLSKFKQNQPTFKQHDLAIKSNQFITNKKMAINSTIPASKNWLIYDNGKLIKQNRYKFMNAFLSFNLSKGKHQLTLIYVPKMLFIGIALSTLSVLIYILDKKRNFKKQKMLK